MKLLVITLLVAGALARPDVSHLVNKAQSDSQAQILRQSLDQEPNGKYYWSIETDNGINAHEHGEETADGNLVGGAFGFRTPEGENIEVKYTADANGYHPEGAHLPQSPPIPEPILRALQYISAHQPAPSVELARRQ